MKRTRPTITDTSASQKGKAFDLFQVFLVVPSFQVRFQYTLETVSGFIIPYAIIITSYILILKRLRKTLFYRKARSEKLILAIVVTFGVFWLPYHVVNMIQVSEGSCSPHPITSIQLWDQLLVPVLSTENVLWLVQGGSCVVPRGVRDKRYVSILRFLTHYDPLFVTL